MTPGTLRHPEWLPLVAGAVAFAAALVAAGAQRARRRLRRLEGPGRRATGVLRDAALVAALAAVGTALLAPRIGDRLERATSSGVDVVVLFDVSRSMEVRDVPPSRLARAIRVAEDLLVRLRSGDRAALAAFGGHGVLLTPLTPDLDALIEMLPGVDPDLMQGRGSELGGGVRAALTAFEEGSTRPRLLLVLSDGEAPDSDAASDLGADDAVRSGARVIAVALGTLAGGVVPDHGVPLLDDYGRTVVSRRDDARLDVLAQATGGELLATDRFGAVDDDHAIASLRRDAVGAAGAPLERRVPAPRVAPFAALAFALLAGEALAGRPSTGRRPAWLARRRAAAAAAALATALAAGPAAPGDETEAPRDARSLDATRAVNELEAALRAQPPEPGALVALGLARAGAGLDRDAGDAFLAAAFYARDPSLASLAWYDRGVSLLAQDDLERARDAFFDALALAPGERQAQFNLEWTLRALAERSPPPPRSSDAGERRPEETDSENEPGAQDGKDGAARSDAAPGAPHESSRDPEQGEDGRGEPRPGPARPGAPDGAPEPPGAEQAREATGGAAAPGNARAGVPSLTPDEARRRLSAVSEDPGAALRHAARRATEASPPTGAPAPGRAAW